MHRTLKRRALKYRSGMQNVFSFLSDRDCECNFVELKDLLLLHSNLPFRFLDLGSR